MLKDLMLKSMEVSEIYERPEEITMIIKADRIASELKKPTNQNDPLIVTPMPDLDDLGRVWRCFRGLTAWLLVLSVSTNTHRTS